MSTYLIPPQLGRRSFRNIVTLALLCGLLPDPAGAAPANAAASNAPLPIRGLHLSAPGKRDLAATVEFIRSVLPKEGVNTLILEFNYEFDFQSLPEFANPSALGKSDVQDLLRACRAGGIELIPQINCLGHQSWAERTGPLLTRHPEFDETPGKYPGNKDIYCRSYCPLHPEVHKVLFALIVELATAAEARSFHIGMDEVFILADEDCPRCGGKKPAELFAGEIRKLHEHLRGIGCRLWMWGDRFLESSTTGLGKWEASENRTASAIDLVPKDIVICDWHYDQAAPTAKYFIERGFSVVTCPWRKPTVALAQLEQIRALRTGPDAILTTRALGMLQTTWCGPRQFIAAYHASTQEGQAPTKNAIEAVDCFKTLFHAMRGPAAASTP